MAACLADDAQWRFSFEQELANDNKLQQLPAAHILQRTSNDGEIGTSPIGQRQRVASKLKARPVKGAPNVVGTPAIVGTPLWVLAHVGVLGAADTDGVEGGSCR